MGRLAKARILLVAVVMALLLPGTVTGGQVSSGGPWTYSNQYTICRFSGDHGSENNKAFARTTNFNGGRKGLAVRLKSNPGALVSPWLQVSPGYPATIKITDNLAGSTAVASQHKGQESWWDSWSPVQQPHAW
jgi:hypothetical protein